MRSRAENGGGHQALDERVDALAADWLARREAGFTVEEQAEFSRWLLADERHAAAVARIGATWRRMQRPRFAGQSAGLMSAIELQVAHRQRRARSRWKRAVIAVPLAAAAAVAVLLQAFRPMASDHQPVWTAMTGNSEWRRLPDGSAAELNSGAQIVLEFTPERRAVRLLQGEAHFAVAKDASRPFVVTAGRVAVRAVGTEFVVRLASDEVGVLVTEGRVAVESTAEPDGPARPAAHSAQAARASALPIAFVPAGNQVTVSAEARAPLPVTPRPLTAAQMQQALAWRTQRVEFTDTPLHELIAVFNARNTIQLAVATPDVAELRISGVFRADDPDAFARLVAASAELQLDRGADGVRVLRR